MKSGWDPVFEYEGQTYAEMDKTEKVGDSPLSRSSPSSSCRPKFLSFQPCPHSSDFSHQQTSLGVIDTDISI
jgi:hypothetical protein